MVVDLNKAYDEYEQNQGGLIVISAFNSGDDAKCEQWNNGEISPGAVEKVKYITISGESGGIEIVNDYDPEQVPTIILIAPDQSIVEKEIWPSTDIPSVLDKYTIGITGKIDNSPGNVDKIARSPDIEIKSITCQKITLSVSKESMYKMVIYSVSGKSIHLFTNRFLQKGEHDIFWSREAFSNGVYFIQLRSGDLTIAEKIVLK